MLWEILKASKGILVADFYADLWANIAGGGTPVDVFVEMIGTLPLYYNGKGYDLTDYLISGNAVQDGTPSADAPVDAVGSGVRTGNLFDYRTMADGTLGYYLDENGSERSSSAWAITGYIPCNGTSFTLNAVGGSFPAICLYDESKQLIGAQRYGTGGAATKAAITVTSAQPAKYIRFSWYRNHDVAYDDPETLMLNLGSTPLPYEPYGYKLPLTVNSTEYPIYLGTVQTTRRVKKLVLTGEESGWTDLDIYYTTTAMNVTPWRSCLCTHCEYGGIIGGNSSTRIWIKKASFPNYTSLDAFKSYLAAQYAAGTPVTVWYVLAEPETGIVNEPLMKIGDYADTISFAQAGVTIPTVSGANVLDMASPVKPSEVYVKGKGIKPTGYGQLADVNGVTILDKNRRPIYVHGQ